MSMFVKGAVKALCAAPELSKEETFSLSWDMLYKQVFLFQNRVKSEILPTHKPHVKLEINIKGLAKEDVA